VFTYACVLVDGHTGELTWVNGFEAVDAPVFQAMRPWLASYGTTTSNMVWLGLTLALLVAGYWTARRGSNQDQRHTLPQKPNQSSTT
jgi:hypothetical protein